MASRPQSARHYKTKGNKRCSDIDSDSVKEKEEEKKEKKHTFINE